MIEERKVSNEEYAQSLQKLGRFLEGLCQFNGNKFGFGLFIIRCGDDVEGVDYISNVAGEDMARLLKAFLETRLSEKAGEDEESKI